MTKTMPTTPSTARSVWTMHSTSLDETSTDQRGQPPVKLPTIGTASRATLRTVVTCPTKLSAYTNARSDELCICIDNGPCHLKRHVTKPLLTKRHSTGELTKSSRAGSSYRRPLLSERLRRPQTARPQLSRQQCVSSACDIDPSSQVDDSPIIDAESIEKCRRWVETLPGKFSGLCRVLSVPESSPGYNDVPVTYR